MRGIETGKVRIRHEVFTEIARMAYEGGDYAKRLEELPFKIIPGEIGSYRDSLFLERAVVGERLRLAMGLPQVFGVFPAPGRRGKGARPGDLLRKTAHQRHQVRVQPLPGQRCEDYERVPGLSGASVHVGLPAAGHLAAERPGPHRPG